MNTYIKHQKNKILLFHPAQFLSPQSAFLFFFFLKSVSYPSPGGFNACDTYAYILKAGRGLWLAIHTTLHLTVFPYGSVLSCPIIFTGGVWMHHNLFTWSLYNGNFGYSRYFVITKNCFSEHPWHQAFPTCADVLSQRFQEVELLV